MDNRSNILTCALRLFALYGYDAVGVQQIVDTAGITKPTLYHYFGSKGGLLRVILEENFSELIHKLEYVTTYHGDLTLTLNKTASVYFHYANTHRQFYRMQLASWFAPPDSESFKAVIRYNEIQQALLETLFTNTAQDHGNMKGRQHAYAATFLGMVNTYIGLLLNVYSDLDEVLIYKAVHQFMHGIFS